MKTQTEIEDRVRLLLKQELDRRVAAASQKLPHLCQHNHRQPLDIRKQVEGMPNDTYNRVSNLRGLPVVQTMGLCMLGAENPEEWPGTICEDPIDAQRCPYFDAKEKPSVIEQTFRAQMEDDAWVRDNLPEIRALLWSLDTTELPKASEAPTPLSWWRRLIVSWALGVPVEGMKVLPGPKGG